MMSNAIHERHPLFPLSQWIGQVCYQPNLHVRVRLRGNVLHVLLEAPSVPRQSAIAKALVKALQILDINTLIPGQQAPLYQVMLYGRKQSETRPAWTMPIYLNQLPQHLAELQARDMQQMANGMTTQAAHPVSEIAQPETQQPEFRSAAAPVHHQAHSPAMDSTEAATSASAKYSASSASDSQSSNPASQISEPDAGVHLTDAQSSAALVLPTRSLAKRGTPEGIACYLSEILNILGISVQVKVKTLPIREGGVALSTKRMWILCEAPYSPDPRVVAEPTAQRLRDLELEGFQDAVILIQVQGEPKPEWFLRVDLTPKTELLKEWARWGDLGAIAALANEALPQDIHVTPELKAPTLYLFCRRRATQPSAAGANAQADAADSANSLLPDQATVQTVLEPLLESLAPQGIHAAVLYGQGAPQTSPVWMHWLNLPAAEHEALAARTQDLASQGDRPALAYWLMRSLNLDLPHQLATGGVRIQLAQRGDVLHIMADAPVCPSRRQVGAVVAKEMRRLKVPGIKGVRVYGRRAGQKRPLWSYGIDLQPRPRQPIVPEATPEFAASEAYVGDLISRAEEDVVIRDEITSETVRHQLAEFWQQRREQMQGMLLRSQLFVPQSSAQDLKTTQNEPSVPVEEPHRRRSLLPVAAVWGAVGLLVVFQVDWIGGQILNTAQSAQQEVVDESTMPINESALASSDPPLDAESPFWEEANITFSLPGEDEDSADDDGDDGFAQEGFTDDSDPTVIDPNQPETDTRSNQRQLDLEASPFQDRLAALDYSYATFNSRQMDVKMALYQRQVDQFGVPDVLVFGSSRSLRGVDPAKLKEDLAAQGYEDVSIFNFGINGATAQVADLILRRFLTQEQLPKLIIWADGARAFNSGRLDVTYNGIVASEGYQDLMAKRAEQLAAEAAAASDDEAAEAAQQAAEELAAEVKNDSLFSSYQAVDQNLEQTVSNWSALHPERDRIKGFLQERLAAWLPFSMPEPLAINAQMGDQVSGSDSDSLLSAEGESLIDVDGFLPISTQFNPATYYQQYARVSGLYDGDYKDFSLEGKQAEAFSALLDFTAAQGISVVFVNTPTTDEYMDAVRSEHEQEFIRWMLQQSASHDSFVFRDLSKMWPQQYAYFSDPSHLNRYGAYQVSERIAQDPMIPWSDATPPDTDDTSD